MFTWSLLYYFKIWRERRWGFYAYCFVAYPAYGCPYSYHILSETKKDRYYRKVTINTGHSFSLFCFSSPPKRSYSLSRSSSASDKRLKKKLFQYISSNCSKYKDYICNSPKNYFLGGDKSNGV